MNMGLREGKRLAGIRTQHTFFGPESLIAGYCVDRISEEFSSLGEASSAFLRTAGFSKGSPRVSEPYSLLQFFRSIIPISGTSAAQSASILLDLAFVDNFFATLVANCPRAGAADDSGDWS